MADIISRIELPDNKVYDIKDNSKVAKTGDTMTGNLTAPKFIGALDEANLTWGGKNFSASYGCIDAALMDELGANRFQFIKADAITVEYSRDGGSTWIDYGASDVQKQQIFAQGGSLIIGKADSTHKATEHPGLYQLRITIDTGVAGVYTYLNKFIIYVGTNGSANCICKIQKALQSTPTTFIDHTDWIPIAGWSGYNVLNVNSFATYGNSPSSQYGRVRFIFKDGTGGNTNYIGLSVSQIKAFGGVGWSTPSTMAKTGHIYSYDQNQNVTFPGNVTAPKFIGALQGNANTASNAQTVNGHTVNSDVPSNATFTDTTYTFANGTNGFTVTPSGGTAQTVTVTPSITNNVTGSGTSGYLAKFNGANTITNGAQLGSDTTKFLRNDGTWAVPPGAGVTGNNAGYHNSIYRGKSLGTSITTAQWSAISAGTFDDMYIGDYWTLSTTIGSTTSNIQYVIAGFDYWWNCGDSYPQSSNKHHVVLVPATILYSAQMNATNITTGGYIGSAMYTTNLANARTGISTLFGNHLYSVRRLFTNSVNTVGQATGCTWATSSVDLMSETMVYGHPVWTTSGFEVGVDRTILPLFALNPASASIYSNWWLRSVATPSYFALVSTYGNATYYNASTTHGVRPAFAIC